MAEAQTKTITQKKKDQPIKKSNFSVVYTTRHSKGLGITHVVTTITKQ